MKVIVEADGGSRGNPGPAGFGSVVWSADHSTVLAEIKEAIGSATNNVAEYRGLIAGLTEAANLGASDVDAFLDSKLVVEQMSGRWKVKHPDLAQLHQEARRLASGFERISFSWIPREKNSHADRLANEAMDAAAVLRIRRPRPAGPAHRERQPGCCCCATARPSLSAQRRYSGRGDPALTDLGRRQADAAAEYLARRGGIAAVVTSPLQRAYDTAATAAKALGVDVVVDDDLIETDFGAWEGLTFTEAAERDPDTAPKLAGRHQHRAARAVRASPAWPTGCVAPVTASSPSMAAPTCSSCRT